MMNNRRFLLILALGIVLALLFAVSATAGSLLECKGELPGGYRTPAMRTSPAP